MSDDFEAQIAKLKADMERPTLSNRFYWRGKRIEKAYVTGQPSALRSLSRSMIVGFIVAFVAIVMYPLILLHAWWWVGALVNMVIACLALHGAWMMRHRAAAYRSGWLDGRRAVYQAMQEGDLGGMDMRQVVEAEQIRDFTVRF